MKTLIILPHFSRRKVSHLGTQPPPFPLNGSSNIPFAAFNEFVSERERTPPISTTNSTSTAFPELIPVQSSIALFDAIILSKRDRGRLRPTIPTITLSRHNPFSRLIPASTSTPKSSSSNPTTFLTDTTEHLYRTAAASNTSERETYRVDFGEGRDYRTIVRRVPAKLEQSLMREPRMVSGVPLISERVKERSRARKPLPVLLPLPLPLREKGGAGERERLNGLGLHAPDSPSYGETNSPRSRGWVSG
jgi:hypothetical protein